MGIALALVAKARAESTVIVRLANISIAELGRAGQRTAHRSGT